MPQIQSVSILKTIDWSAYKKRNPDGTYSVNPQIKFDAYYAWNQYQNDRATGPLFTFVGAPYQDFDALPALSDVRNNLIRQIIAANHLPHGIQQQIYVNAWSPWMEFTVLRGYNVIQVPPGQGPDLQPGPALQPVYKGQAKVPGYIDVPGLDKNGNLVLPPVKF